MNKFIDPPCKSLTATSFFHGMKSQEELREKYLFTEPVGSADEVGLEIDEEASTVKSVPNPRNVPDSNLTAKEGEECVRRASKENEADIGGHADCRVEGNSEKDSFLDIVGSLEQDNEGECEGFTFTDMLLRADLLSEILSEGIVDTPDMPLC